MNRLPRWGGNLTHSLIDSPETTELLRLRAAYRAQGKMSMVNYIEIQLARYCTTDEGTGR